MRAAAGLAAALLLAGCAARDPSAPPRIAYGEHACARCGMLTADARFASAAVEPDGAAHVYDDIGCLLEVWRSGALTGMRLWVHDHESMAWIRAEAATFVLAPGIESPMGFGLAAFAGPEDAVAFAAQAGARSLSWLELVSSPPTGGSTP